MASGNFISSTGTNLNLYVVWSSTTNVSANTSTVTADVYMRSYTISGKALADSYIAINGNKKSFAGISLSKTSNSLTDTKIASHTATISHNTDGKKSVTITANLEFNGTVSGKYLSDITASKTVALDTIPRSSTFSVPSSVNTGSALAVAITPSSSTFRHKFQFVVNGVTKHTSDYIAVGVKSYSYTIPHSWLPKTATQEITLNCYTYPESGDTAIASTPKTFTANVPANIKPTISKVATTLVNGLNGKYVQGKSQITLTVTASPGNDSSITSYDFTGANINGSSSSYSGTSNTKTSSVIQSIDAVTYSVVAWDARGRYSDPYKINIDVQKYAAPKIVSISAQRCLKDGTVDGNGTYAKVVVEYSYESVDGANTKQITLYNNILNSSKSVDATLTLVSDNTSLKQCTYIYGGNFEIAQSYEIKAIITDHYNMGAAISKSIVLETAQRTINIARYGNGVAVGGLSTVTKASDAGKFESNWDTQINGKLAVTNNITTNGNFGCTNPYGGGNFAMYCQWADGSNHDILVRGTDGLSMGLGWTGGDNYETSLDIRPKKVKIRGTTHFQCTNDAATNAQNDVPVRIGNANGTHIDMDGNEIIAKDSPTTLGNLNFGGKIIAMYVDEVDTLRTSSDSTSTFVKSVPTYNRTYDSSPNMYITSNGVFGRSTSSSQRYKTEIKDVKDDTLNPYNILNIPVRQFKYNEDNIPINKDKDDVYIGLIAEEVAQVYPIAAEYNEDGQVEMWNIKTIVPAMLKIIQDQQKEINELKQKVNGMQIK